MAYGGKVADIVIFCLVVCFLRIRRFNTWSVFLNADIPNFLFNSRDTSIPKRRDLIRLVAREV